MLDELLHRSGVWILSPYSQDDGVAIAKPAHQVILSLLFTKGTHKHTHTHTHTKKEFYQQKGYIFMMISTILSAGETIRFWDFKDWEYKVIYMVSQNNLPTNKPKNPFRHNVSIYTQWWCGWLTLKLTVLHPSSKTTYFLRNKEEMTLVRESKYMYASNSSKQPESTCENLQTTPHFKPNSLKNSTWKIWSKPHHSTYWAQPACIPSVWSLCNEKHKWINVLTCYNVVKCTTMCISFSFTLSPATPTGRFKKESTFFIKQTYKDTNKQIRSNKLFWPSQLCVRMHIPLASWTLQIFHPFNVKQELLDSLHL